MLISSLAGPGEVKEKEACEKRGEEDRGMWIRVLGKMIFCSSAMVLFLMSILLEQKSTS